MYEELGFEHFGKCETLESLMIIGALYLLSIYKVFIIILYFSQLTKYFKRKYIMHCNYIKTLK